MFIPPILKRYGFNKRQIPFEEVEEICRYFKLWIRYTNEEEFEGIFYPHPKRNVIVLNENLKGLWRLFIAHHELNHFLLGHKGVKYFLKGSEDRAERIADALAVISVLPRPLYEEIKRDEILLINTPRRLLKLREDVELKHCL